MVTSYQQILNAIKLIFTKPLGWSKVGILYLLSKTGWRNTISIILIFLLLFTATTKSIKEKDMSIIFFEIGGRLASADSMINLEVQDMKKNPQKYFVPDLSVVKGTQKFKLIWERIKQWTKISVSFWFIYYLGFVIYYLIINFMLNDISMMFSGILITIMILSFIYWTFNLLYFIDDVYMKNLPAEDLQNFDSLKFESQASRALYTLKNTYPWKGILSLYTERDVLYGGLQKSFPYINKLDKFNVLNNTLIE